MDSTRTTRTTIPAQGSIFAGQPVNGPLLIDETSGVPVPIPPDAPSAEPEGAA